MRFHRSLSAFLLAAVAAGAAWGAPAPQTSSPAPAASAASPKAAAQPPAAQAPSNLPVIREQSNVVRVDAVVTDKKGNYVRDLDKKDFRVWEDGKEQSIVSFSAGEGTPVPNAPEAARYMVLFFDNASMGLDDQSRARKAALDFVRKAASPGRQMAVVEFGGTMSVAQNFTSSAELLAKAVASVQPSAVHTNPNPSSAFSNPGLQGLNGQVLGGPGGGSTFTDIESDFAAQTVLLALRDISKRMALIPGRKSLILFTSGFPLTADRQSEVTATIDAANKSNVAIYPLDVRGLTGLNLGGKLRAPVESPRNLPPMILAAYHPDSTGNPWNGLAAAIAPNDAALLDGQHGGSGGGGGGGGGRGGGGVGGGGGTGGKGGTGGGGGGTGGGGGGKGGTGGGGGGGPVGRGGSIYNPINALNQPRQIVPPFPQDATTNQQVLYELAAGTGGFPILNSNDLLAGMEKIFRELDEYYVLGYALPERTANDQCHTIKVKVERGGSNVRARSGYCDTKNPDVLAGKPEGAALEARAAAGKAGGIPVTLRAPFFYTAENTARVAVSMELSGSALKFARGKKGMQSEVDVVGIAYRADGSVAGRFSDAVKLDVEKDQMEALEKKPFQYQNTFDLPPGNYTLKVALTAGGEDYASAETPLAIDPYDGKGLGISGVVLSNNIHSVAAEDSLLDSELIQDHKSYVVKGLQLEPSVRNEFSKKDKEVGFYTELYDARLTGPTPPKVALIFAILDLKTNKAVFTAPVQLANQFAVAGNPVIQVAMKLPIEQLPPGQYRLEVRAGEPQGAVSALRTADFTMN